MSNSDARIDELEMKLSFQEQVIAELNDAVTAQSTQLASVERSLDLLQARLETVSIGASDPTEEPPPPHY